MNRRMLVCLQWATGLSNGFYFWTYSTEGRYVLAALSLLVLLLVACWKIPPKEDDPQ